MSAPVLLPANINVAGARLPMSYEKAKQALTACSNIDECVGWGDKAAALAAYAKQARDEDLLRLATRIKDRAIRRAGELLRQIEPGQGARAGKRGIGSDTPLYRADAARDAGMSKRQAVTAVRVANVPIDEFERQVESDAPPSVTKLAAQGTRPVSKPIVDLKGRDPEAFNRSLHFVAEFEEYAKALAGFDLDTELPALDAEEARRVRESIASIDAIHDRIVTRI